MDERTRTSAVLVLATLTAILTRTHSPAFAPRCRDHVDDPAWALMLPLDASRRAGCLRIPPAAAV